MKPMTQIIVTMLLMSSIMECSASEKNKLHGVGYIAITTDNLSESTRFYTLVMGGKLLYRLSTAGFGFQGDEFYRGYFNKELIEAKRLGVDPATLGVVDVRLGGDHEVHWNFVLLDNVLIQLLQFFPLNSTQPNPTLDEMKRKSSPAFLRAPTLSFWVHQNVDINEYIDKLEETSQIMAFHDVIFNYPVKLASKDDRKNVPKSDYALSFDKGDFAGVSLSYAKGPGGEQLKLYHLNNDTRGYVMREYCDRPSVSTSFLDDYYHNMYKQNADMPGKNFGIYTFATQTADLEKSVKFYSEILGGSPMKDPLHQKTFKGDAVHNLLFQVDEWKANEHNIKPIKAGIPNISDSGKMKLETQYILFDDIQIEINQIASTKTKFKSEYDVQTPASVNNMFPSFAVDKETNLNEYVKQILDKSTENDFREVIGNSVSDSEDNYVVEFKKDDLEGFKFAMVKGPSGEQIGFCQFTGVAEQVLKNEMLDYGAVSTLFEETNSILGGKSDYTCGFKHYYDTIHEEL